MVPGSSPLSPDPSAGNLPGPDHYIQCISHPSGFRVCPGDTEVTSNVDEACLHVLQPSQDDLAGGLLEMKSAG